MPPELKARKTIDEQLIQCGWVIQDYENLNLGESLGVAIREFPLGKDHADYLLFIDRVAVGVIEAKKIGSTLSGVAEQSQSYLTNMLDYLSDIKVRPVFAYETTGIETFFRDTRDPETRSRKVFTFHRPETLKEWLEIGDPEKKTLRNNLRIMPPTYPLITEGLRDCQIEAIKNLEQSLSDNRPRALIQMATGSGKTFTAVSAIYRLIKFSKAKRVLFLVDRKTLGTQAEIEFQQYVTPDDGRKFTELYNVQHLKSNTIDSVNKVVITTIQRLYSMLRGDIEFKEDSEEISMFDPSVELYSISGKSKEISYNPKIPIETFDFIVTDECHRSIYDLWRQVLEYFDSYIIGLTATPSKETIGFFNNNLVMEYTHERAVADGVNVGYEVYRIKTKVTEEGGKVEAGHNIDRRDKITRKERWERLDADLEYTKTQLDRSVVTPDQIRTVIRTFKEDLFTKIFPRRSVVPKTLVFAKDDSHAEDIVRIIKEEFVKGNEFCKKITYRTTGEKPEDLIASFRTSYNPRIAVTVDMISTGTDIKPLECLVFMRDVKSSIYFEQMKGRGSRTIDNTDFQSVTFDKYDKNKTHFVIIDAVGVCESNKTDSNTLERKKGVSFDKLIKSVAIGKKDEDTLTSLGSRLAKLGLKISEKDRDEVEQVARKPLKELILNLFNAHDVDKQIENARLTFNTENPSKEQLEKSKEELIKKATTPFDNPKIRNLLIDVQKRNEQVIDTITIDELISSEFDQNAKEKSKMVIDTFKKFIEENKDEITALQIIYNRSYSQKQITLEEIKQLAEVIKKPPYLLSTDILWKAYEQLDISKVRRSGPTKLLTDIISLIKFSIGQEETLKPYSEIVDEKFKQWIVKQETLGKKFTKEQLEWLEMIMNHLSTSLTIETEDFEYSPFIEKGGLIKVHHQFGTNFDNILNDLNQVVILK